MTGWQKLSKFSFSFYWKNQLLLGIFLQILFVIEQDYLTAIVLIVTFLFLREVAAFPAEFVRSDNKVEDDNYSTKPNSCNFWNMSDHAHGKVWWAMLMFFLSNSCGQVWDELMTHMETRTWWAKMNYFSSKSEFQTCHQSWIHLLRCAPAPRWNRTRAPTLFPGYL